MNGIGNTGWTLLVTALIFLAVQVYRYLQQTDEQMVEWWEELTEAWRGR